MSHLGSLEAQTMQSIYNSSSEGKLECLSDFDAFKTWRNFEGMPCLKGNAREKNTGC